MDIVTRQPLALIALITSIIQVIFIALIVLIASTVQAVLTVLVMLIASITQVVLTVLVMLKQLSLDKLEVLMQAYLTEKAAWLAQHFIVRLIEYCKV